MSLSPSPSNTYHWSQKWEWGWQKQNLLSMRNLSLTPNNKIIFNWKYFQLTTCCQGKQERGGSFIYPPSSPPASEIWLLPTIWEKEFGRCPFPFFFTPNTSNSSHLSSPAFDAAGKQDVEQDFLISFSLLYQRLQRHGCCPCHWWREERRLKYHNSYPSWGASGSREPVASPKEGLLFCGHGTFQSLGLRFSVWLSKMFRMCVQLSYKGRTCHLSSEVQMTAAVVNFCLDF